MFQEYDFEVIVKLGRLNVEPNHLSCIETGEEHTNLKEGFPDTHLFAVCIVDKHFVDIIHFLNTRMTIRGYTSQQKKELVVHTTNFSVIAGHLYKMGSDEILQCCVPDTVSSLKLMEELGGNYAGKARMQNILHVGLWRLTHHKDSKAYCRVCDAC